MENLFLLFGSYAFIGLLMIIFNKHVSEITYNLVLYFTEKMNLKEVFLFKVDDTNKNSMFFLTRTITITFGLVIISTSFYFMFHI